MRCTTSSQWTSERCKGGSGDSRERGGCGGPGRPPYRPGGDPGCGCGRPPYRPGGDPGCGCDRPPQPGGCGPFRPEPGPGPGPGTGCGCGTTCRPVWVCDD
ncbi:MAG: hypothetical protein PUH42_09190 [Firmicutes bacterium]|uniref:hypothetical protein n=1 Tax=Lentihominibacter sp. TaxID=2944216 RepID=UPI002A505A5C|nr:hypothetical protein [Lentihominibacter sp.]MCI5853207.1 hypothetical protein [Clostridiales bacterium]MDD7321219.1 hypothetical protein [Bacillota bacterium]MDY5287989.1 hypothetical protein [Lentihominibacter sp.]